MTESITTAIIDDEPLGRKLIHQLMREEPDLRLVGEAGTVAAAVEMLASLRPDIVFLDVAFPDGNAFDVLHGVGPAYSSITVFITAHDKHAVRAFDVDAADYLLKPIKRERFHQAVARARLLHEARYAAPLAAAAAQSAPHPRPRRLAIGDEDDRLTLLSVDDIDWVEAARNYVRIRAGGADHTFRESITALERRLDPQQFVRTHRSFIVNVDRIAHLEPNAYGDYVVTLRNGVRLPMSRRYRERLTLLIGRL
jgi:two-component system LytT family response regulator